MAARVAVAADLGQPRTTGRLERAAALHRRGIEQQQIVAAAGALGGEDADQPLDRLRQASPPLMQRVLAGQMRKQVAELAAGRTQEAAIARDPHQRLSDTQRHDLSVRKPPASVTRPLRQQVVSRAIDTDQEQVEVGDHRWLQSDGDRTPPTSTCPTRSLATTQAVASII